MHITRTYYITPLYCSLETMVMSTDKEKIYFALQVSFYLLPLDTQGFHSLFELQIRFL